jgi:CRISPR system Cascade subunit CasE
MKETKCPEFYMVSIPLFLDDVLRVVQTKYTAFKVKELDSGYLLHLFFSRVFGSASPKPFFVSSKQGTKAKVLAYSDLDAKALLEIAKQFTTPEEFEAIDWTQVASKPMPTSWARGRILRFDVLACPVVRSAKDTKFYKKGAEVDVFLQRCTNEGKGETLDRQAVYCEWCKNQIEKDGAATALDVMVRSFRLTRIFRNSHNGGSGVKQKWCLRPEVRFSGLIEVLDQEKFSRLLRRGIGRHRAFGFGMLLLAPARGA